MVAAAAGGRARSMKAGAFTPATHVVETDALPSCHGRSMKAGAFTPATLASSLAVSTSLGTAQ